MRSRLLVALAALPVSMSAGCVHAPLPAPITLVRDTPARPVAAAVVAPTPAVAAPSVEASAPAAEVDLLRATTARVAVSSAVDSETDTPANLVDGDLATVWSSVPGELERTSIRVRLPSDARVSAFELTAGHTRPDETRDLFTSNVRIARVRISHDGAVVGEFPLDPEVRTMQRVAVQGGGGEWRIDTVGLVPGTEARWRRVSVSELRVMGTPGREGVRTPLWVSLVSVQGQYDDEPPANTIAASAAIRNELSQAFFVDGSHAGCSGNFVNACVRRTWVSIARAGVGYARALCGDAQLTTQLAAWRTSNAALERVQERQDRVFQADGDFRAVDMPANAAFGVVIEAARSVYAACPNARGLRTLGRLLGREQAALRSYRWRE